MRITIDISAETLQDVVRLTGERKKSPAIAKAAEEFVRRRKAQELGRLLRESAFDYPITNDAIESLEDAEHGPC
jgi:hypothetical protein